MSPRLLNSGLAGGRVGGDRLGVVGTAPRGIYLGGGWGGAWRWRFPGLDYKQFLGLEPNVVGQGG